MTTATYNPRFQPQLTGIDTEGEDCGPRSVQMSLDWATHGRLVPTIPTIRKRMIKSIIGPTNTLDWEACIESYDTPAELHNRYRKLVTTRLAGDGWDHVVAALRKGWGVVLAVDYGVLHALAPSRTGSDSYKDAHAIFLKGIHGSHDDYVQSFDDLNDHRRKGIPQGPVWVATSAMQKAALAYGKANGHPNGVYAVIVEPAVPLHAPLPPSPKPPVPDKPPVVEVPVVEDKVPTLASILVDLYDLLATGVVGTQPIIDDVETLIGPYTGPGKPDAEPAQGLKK